MYSLSEPYTSVNKTFNTSATLLDQISLSPIVVIPFACNPDCIFGRRYLELQTNRLNQVEDIITLG